MAIRTSATVNFEANTAPMEKGARQAFRRLENLNVNLNVKNDALRPLGRITGQVNEFNKSLEASNARVLAFGASAGAVFLVQKAIKSLVSTTVEVQRELANINVLLGLSSRELKGFSADLFNVAKGTAQSFSTAAKAAAEFSRQGLSMEETLRRTNAALVLTRLSGLDAQKSVEALTATVNSFAEAGLDAVEVVNKLANVDASFAVSSADLAEAIQRVGSSATDAGVSFDELIALVTTAQQITARGGSVIGNSFKTIFTRLQRGKTVDLLENLGISSKDSTGQVKSMIQLLKELASTYDQLGSVQQAYVAEQVGGVFQINILKAALGDLNKEYSIFDRALSKSLGTTDEAITRNAQLNETIEALAQQAATNIQQLAATIGNTVFEPKASAFLKSFNEIFDYFSDVDPEGFGSKIGKGLLQGLSNFIAGPGAVLVGFAAIKFFKGFVDFAQGSFRELLGLNDKIRERELMQQSILSLLGKEQDLMRQLIDGEITKAQASEKITQIFRDQNTVLTEQNRMAKEIASIMTGAGMRMSPVAGGKAVIPIPRAERGGKASGFIPHLSETMGAIEHGYKPGRIFQTRIYDGKGSSQTSYVNSAEKIFNFKNSDGKRATMVVPPNGFGKNTQYASRGFVPNFASGLTFKRGEADGFGISTLSGYMGKKKVGELEYSAGKSGTTVIEGFEIDKAFRGKGLSREFYEQLRGMKVVGTMLPQFDKSGGVFFPQLGRASMAKNAKIAQYGAAKDEILSVDKFKNLVTSKKRDRGFWNSNTFDLFTQLSSGFVPNFAANLMGGRNQFQMKWMMEEIKKKGLPPEALKDPEIMMRLAKIFAKKYPNNQGMFNVAGGFIPNFAGNSSYNGEPKPNWPEFDFSDRIALVTPSGQRGAERYGVQMNQIRFGGWDGSGIPGDYGINYSVYRGSANYENFAKDAEAYLVSAVDSLAQNMVGGTGIKMTGKSILEPSKLGGMTGSLFEGVLNKVFNFGGMDPNNNKVLDLPNGFPPMMARFLGIPEGSGRRGEIKKMGENRHYTAKNLIGKIANTFPDFGQMIRMMAEPLPRKKRAAPGNKKGAAAFSGFVPNFSYLEKVAQLESGMSGNKATFHTSPFPHFRNTSQPTFQSAMRDHGGLKNAIGDSVMGQKSAGLLSGGFVPNFAPEDDASGGRQGFDLGAIVIGLQGLAFTLAIMGKSASDVSDEFKNFKIDEAQSSLDRLNKSFDEASERLKAAQIEAETARAGAKALSSEPGALDAMTTYREGKRKTGDIDKSVEAFGFAREQTMLRGEDTGILDARIEGLKKEKLRILEQEIMPARKNYKDMKKSATSQRFIASKKEQEARLAANSAKAEADILREKIKAAQAQKKTALQQVGGFLKNKGFALGSAATTIAPQVAQFIGDETSNRRGYSAVATGFGNAAGLAATGGMIGGPKGAVVGGAIGIALEVPKIINAFTSKIPDMEKAAEKSAEVFRKVGESGQSLFQNFEKIKNLDLTTLKGLEDFRKIDSEISNQASSFVNAIPDEERFSDARALGEEVKAEINVGNFEKATELLSKLQEDVEAIKNSDALGLKLAKGNESNRANELLEGYTGGYFGGANTKELEKGASEFILGSIDLDKFLTKNEEGAVLGKRDISGLLQASSRASALGRNEEGDRLSANVAGLNRGFSSAGGVAIKDFVTGTNAFTQTPEGRKYLNTNLESREAFDLFLDELANILGSDFDKDAVARSNRTGAERAAFAQSTQDIFIKYDEDAKNRVANEKEKIENVKKENDAIQKSKAQIQSFSLSLARSTRASQIYSDSLSRSRDALLEIQKAQINAAKVLAENARKFGMDMMDARDSAEMGALDLLNQSSSKIEAEYQQGVSRAERERTYGEAEAKDQRESRLKNAGAERDRSLESIPIEGAAKAIELIGSKFGEFTKSLSPIGRLDLPENVKKAQAQEALKSGVASAGVAANQKRQEIVERIQGGESITPEAALGEILSVATSSLEDAVKSLPEELQDRGELNALIRKLRPSDNEQGGNEEILDAIKDLSLDALARRQEIQDTYSAEEAKANQERNDKLKELSEKSEQQKTLLKQQVLLSRARLKMEQGLAVGGSFDDVVNRGGNPQTLKLIDSLNESLGSGKATREDIENYSKGNATGMNRETINSVARSIVTAVDFIGVRVDEGGESANFLQKAVADQLNMDIEKALPQLDILSPELAKELRETQSRIGSGDITDPAYLKAAQRAMNVSAFDKLRESAIKQAKAEGRDEDAAILERDFTDPVVYSINQLQKSFDSWPTQLANILQNPEKPAAQESSEVVDDFIGPKPLVTVPLPPESLGKIESNLSEPKMGANIPPELKELVPPIEMMPLPRIDYLKSRAPDIPDVPFGSLTNQEQIASLKYKRDELAEKQRGFMSVGGIDMVDDLGLSISAINKQIKSIEAAPANEATVRGQIDQFSSQKQGLEEKLQELLRDFNPENGASEEVAIVSSAIDSLNSTIENLMGLIEKQGERESENLDDSLEGETTSGVGEAINININIEGDSSSVSDSRFEQLKASIMEEFRAALEGKVVPPKPRSEGRRARGRAR
jgi:TP901 family phage tail tape measure protein